MRSHESSSQPQTSSSRHSAWLGILLAALVLTLVSCVPGAGRAATAQTTHAQPSPTVISANELEERYGMRVNLIAVTAAGGLVDVRLKVLDANKARQLLKDGAPSVLVDHSDVILVAPEDSPPPDAQLKDDGVVLLLYPNSGNALKPGDEVTLMFGDVHLEPIAVK